MQHDHVLKKLTFDLLTLTPGTYDVYCIGRRQYQRYLNIIYWGCLSSAVDMVRISLEAKYLQHLSNLARGKISTASIN